MHDVVIVGGSLAGSAAAIHLANRGHDVAIVERRTGYRRKACGEGLFPAGVAELHNLGLLGRLDDASQPLSGLRFRAGSETAVADLGPGGGGIGVQRAVLDGVLLEAARAAGATVLEGVTVRDLLVEMRRAVGVATDADDVRARVVVGADGLNSRIRRLAGLQTPRRGHRFGVAAHIRPNAAPEPFVDISVETRLRGVPHSRRRRPPERRTPHQPFGDARIRGGPGRALRRTASIPSCPGRRLRSGR